MADPAFSTPARTAALAGIVAAWSLVTAVPIFASVLLQPVQVDQPLPRHESRTVEVQAHIVDQWKLTWGTQARPKLVQPGAVVATPVLKRTSVQQILAAHYADRGFVTLWTSALAQPIQVDAPPVLHPGRAVDVQAAAVGAWAPALSPTIRQLKLTPAGSAPTADTILSMRPMLAVAAESVTWSAQVRPKLAASILDVPVNDPPSLQQGRAIDQLPTTGLWPMLSWEAQTAKKLPQDGAIAGPSQPSTIIAQAPIGRWEPLAWPAQRRPALPSSLLDVPVNAPPYTSRNSQRDGILAAWIPPPPMPPRSGPVPQPFVASAVNEPPYQHAGRQAQVVLALLWPQPIWDAQARAKLTADTTGVLVNDPPYTAASRAAQQQPVAQALALTWEPQRTGKLPQDGTIAGPSQPSTFISQAPIGRWEPLIWPAQRRPALPSSLLDVPANEPPYTSRRTIMLILVQAWEPLPPLPQRPTILLQGAPPLPSSNVIELDAWFARTVERDALFAANVDRTVEF